MIHINPSHNERHGRKCLKSEQVPHFRRSQVWKWRFHPELKNIINSEQKLGEVVKH